VTGLKVDHGRGRGQPGEPGGPGQAGPGRRGRLPWPGRSRWLRRLTVSLPVRLATARPFAARARLAPGWRRHRLFVIVAAIALLPRVLAALAFRPALFTADSFGYLLEGVHPALGQTRPAGYPVLLWLLAPFHSLLLVTTVQHLMGVATAAIVYAVLRHWGLPAWAAVLAAAPTLFDSRQIMLESAIWPDTLYGLLALGAVALLLTRRTPARWQCAAAGLLLAWCALVRGNGPAVMAPVLAFLLIRRVGWRAVTAGVAAFALPVLGYMTIFYSHYGTFNTTTSDGLFLWSRTLSFANCAVIRPPAGLRPLCPAQQSPYLAAPAPAWSLSALLHEPSPAQYLWQPQVWWRHDAQPGINARNNALAMRFALDAVRAQPGAYAATVAKEVLLTFLATDRSTTFRTMHFTAQPDVRFLPPYYLRDLRLYAHTGSNSHPVQPYAYFLELYQLPVYFPGIVFLLVLAAGLAGVLRRWRSWGGPAALPWAAAALGIVVPVAVHEYHYRYAITAVPLACLAAGLAWSRAAAPSGRTGWAAVLAGAGRDRAAAGGGGRAGATGAGRPGSTAALAGEREPGGQAGDGHHGHHVAVAEPGRGHRHDEERHGDRPGQQDQAAAAPPAGGEAAQPRQQDQPEQGARQVHHPLVAAQEGGEGPPGAGLGEP
jgi:hypothetical protein